MSADRDCHPEAHVPEVDDTAVSPVLIGTRVDRTSFAVIEAEGARERWLLARRTAQSVFTDPAVVTPRRMALLGEQGLAAFVDEVRLAARFLIRRERENRTAEPQPGNRAPHKAAGEGTIKPERAPPAARRRRPAAFQAPRPTPRVPISKTLVRRVRPSAALKRFLGDTLFWSALPAVILIAVVAAHCVAFILLR